MVILKFFQYIFTIIFFIAGFVGAATMGYQFIGDVTNQYSRFEQIFIFFSSLGLIFFPILFLGNITNSHKNIEKLTNFGLIGSIMASIVSLAIVGSNFWGIVCCPGGFNGSIYMFILILLLLFFLNSLILVSIQFRKRE